MRNKRFTKAISTIIAVCTITCATTVNSSALCLNDFFGCGTNGQGGNCGNSIVQIVQCIRSGKCNIFDLFTGKADCTNGDCGDTTGNDCVGNDCDQTPTQTEVIRPATPTTTPTPITTTTNSNVQAVFDLVNKERKAAGLGTLNLSDELCKVADVRAKEIVKSFSHTRPNGTSCFTAFKENGVVYRYAGENIAVGQRTATEVMNGWMNSEGHRANILGKNFGKIGIACYTVNGKNYFVQLFTN